jgi:putative membrane protein
MPETTIRPSWKPILALFAFVVVLNIAILIGLMVIYDPRPAPNWPSLAALALFLWPLSKLPGRWFTKTTVTGDKLYFETGALSKQTRIIQIHKIQDVRVHQSIYQRIVGLGDLSIETAGETSRLTISGIDRPRALAEQLLALVNNDPGRPHAV